MPWTQPSRSFAKAFLLAAALIGVGLAGFTMPGHASPAVAPPVLATGVVENITLYGSALTGWGYGANNTTNPGPHLHVTYGDTIQLTLVSLDGAGVNHNWFLAYDNGTSPASGEPSSPQFSQGNSIVWSFVADRVGTYTYRCEVHPTGMTGTVTISAATHYTLYGDASKGWGFTPTNITKPGPTLVVEKGANVTLTLYSADGTFHTWFIDYNNDSSVDAGETQSGFFGASGNPNPLNYTIPTGQAGTFAYRCGIHTNTMWGMIVILGPPAPAPAKFPIPLIPGIMLGVIIAVLVLAGVYQV
ncbi:MAG TPA: plastocyanin/azurin family copper-binding protein, partial [Thermoplasmata archaeon]|nr:plastocyanin/azurin family copper-binding protein [Thermoplasmata archaeon]